jgi:hypothetical protein
LFFNIHLPSSGEGEKYLVYAAIFWPNSLMNYFMLRQPLTGCNKFKGVGV